MKCQCKKCYYCLKVKKRWNWCKKCKFCLRDKQKETCIRGIIQEKHFKKCQYCLSQEAGPLEAEQVPEMLLLPRGWGTNARYANTASEKSQKAGHYKLCRSKKFQYYCKIVTIILKEDKIRQASCCSKSPPLKYKQIFLCQVVYAWPPSRVTTFEIFLEYLFHVLSECSPRFQLFCWQ